MQAQFLNSPFLIASQEYCTYFLFPPFLVSSAVISSYFLRQSLLFSSPLCGRCCTAAVVHPHDPMTKRRGGCRECRSPVHCGTPLPDVDTFRGTGRCRISQLCRYVCTVRTDRRPFLVPTSNPISCCFLSPGARYCSISCYSVSYRSSFFERHFLRLISYFFKNLRLNFLQNCFL